MIRRTFNHLCGRNGIGCTPQVTGCVIEQKKALGKAVYLVLKDVDCAIDLGDEFFSVEVAITILPRLEDYAGLSAGRLINSAKKLEKQHTPVVIAEASPLCRQKV